MLRTFTKAMSLALVTLLLLALPMTALGEQATAITNAQVGVNAAWSDVLSVTVVVTDEEGNTQEGALDFATADIENVSFAGTVELSYAYGATNMPANILYHALLGLNEGALVRVSGDSLEDEVMEPGTYTVTYTYQSAENQTEELVCTVLVRGAISANVVISDYEIPLSDGTPADASDDAKETATPDATEDEGIDEPIPEVTVTN